MNLKDVGPSTGYGGHLGRHFENNSFPDVGFGGTFSMLLLYQILPNQLKNRLYDEF